MLFRSAMAMNVVRKVFSLEDTRYMILKYLTDPFDAANFFKFLTKDLGISLCDMVSFNWIKYLPEDHHSNCHNEYKNIHQSFCKQYIRGLGAVALILLHGLRVDPRWMKISICKEDSLLEFLAGRGNFYCICNHLIPYYKLYYLFSSLSNDDCPYHETTINNEVLGDYFRSVADGRQRYRCKIFVASLTSYFDVSILRYDFPGIRLLPQSMTCVPQTTIALLVDYCEFVKHLPSDVYVSPNTDPGSERIYYILIVTNYDEALSMKSNMLLGYDSETNLPMWQFTNVEEEFVIPLDGYARKSQKYSHAELKRLLVYERTCCHSHNATNYEFYDNDHECIDLNRVDSCYALPHPLNSLFDEYRVSLHPNTRIVQLSTDNNRLLTKFRDFLARYNLRRWNLHFLFLRSLEIGGFQTRIINRSFVRLHRRFPFEALPIDNATFVPLVYSCVDLNRYGAMRELCRTSGRIPMLKNLPPDVITAALDIETTCYSSSFSQSIRLPQDGHLFECLYQLDVASNILISELSLDGYCAAIKLTGNQLSFISDLDSSKRHDVCWLCKLCIDTCFSSFPRNYTELEQMLQSVTCGRENKSDLLFGYNAAAANRRHDDGWFMVCPVHRFFDSRNVLHQVYVYDVYLDTIMYSKRLIEHLRCHAAVRIIVDRYNARDDLLVFVFEFSSSQMAIFRCKLYELHSRLLNYATVTREESSGRPLCDLRIINSEMTMRLTPPFMYKALSCIAKPYVVASDRIRNNLRLLRSCCGEHMNDSESRMFDHIDVMLCYDFSQLLDNTFVRYETRVSLLKTSVINYKFHMAIVKKMHEWLYRYAAIATRGNSSLSSNGRTRFTFSFRSLFEADRVYEVLPFVEFFDHPGGNACSHWRDVELTVRNNYYPYKWLTGDIFSQLSSVWQMLQ